MEKKPLFSRQTPAPTLLKSQPFFPIEVITGMKLVMGLNLVECYIPYST